MQSQTLLLSPAPLPLTDTPPPATIPRALLFAPMFHRQPRSGPGYPPVLDDDAPRDQPISHPYSISVSDSSRPTSHPLLQAASPPNQSPRLATHAEPSAYASSFQSPPQIRPAPLFPPPRSAPHHTTHFASSETSSPPNIDRYSMANPAVHLRAIDKYSHNQQASLDQRRMSEPTMYGSAASGHPSNTTDLAAVRYQHLQRQISYVSPPSYPAHPSPLHHSSNARPPAEPWKQDNRLSSHRYGAIELEEPLSPLNPTFSGGEGSPSVSMSGAILGSLHEDYGPSPPGTGTSTSSTTPTTHPPTNTMVGPSSPSNAKQYSFVPLPGNGVKKRPRRRYDEIERLYQCSWENCTKAYGTLNHLNAHITMQKHGSKRSPNEFKELRKQWRKAKKEEAEAKALDAMRHASHPLPQLPQHHSSRHTMSNAGHRAQNMRPPLDYSHHSQRPTQSTLPPEDLHDTRHRSHRYTPFISPPFQQSEIPYPHAQTHGVNISDLPVDRLPANSTLLTPLPGYGSTGTPDFNAYSSYGLYRSDSRPRSSPERHSDRGRTRSSHNWPPS